MIECSHRDRDSGGDQFSGSVRSYPNEHDRRSWVGAGEQGLQHAFDQRDCVGLIKKPKVLARLKDLPTKCWTETKNESRGCQCYTKALFGPISLAGLSADSVPSAS